VGQAGRAVIPRDDRVVSGFSRTVTSRAIAVVSGYSRTV